MKVNLIIDSGVALFGTDWIAELAPALGYSRKTLHRWVNAQRIPPAEIRAKILIMLYARAQDLREIIADVEADED